MFSYMFLIFVLFLSVFYYFFLHFLGINARGRKRLYPRKRIKNWNQPSCQERSEQNRTVAKTFERLVIQKHCISKIYCCKKVVVNDSLALQPIKIRKIRKPRWSRILGKPKVWILAADSKPPDLILEIIGQVVWSCKYDIFLPVW